MPAYETVKEVCTRGLVLAPVAALLSSVVLLLLGNGLLGTLLVVRAGREGFRSEIIGVMMSAYFAGYTAGALFLPRLVAAVGHIRTFAGFAAIASMAAIIHLASIEPWAWTVLRAVTGLAYAGMILVTESWLNAHAVKSTRGQLLSIFGAVSMGAWALGQALLNVAPPEDAALFLVVSVLISAAVVPITLLPSRPPVETDQEPLGFRELFRTSSLATTGVLLAGLLSADSGAWGRTSHSGLASMSPTSRCSWQRYCREPSSCIGRLAGSRTECRATSSLPVRPSAGLSQESRSLV